MARRRFVVPIAAALVGVVLFVYAIRAVGWESVVDGIARVGWGLLPILGLAGARFLLRACAWRLCMPAHGRLPVGQAFTAFVAGDAIGNLTPLGMVASELRQQCTDLDSVLERRNELIAALPELAAEKGLELGGLPPDAVVDAASALRCRELQARA